ncbi:hypothetical protein J6590_028277 [Homalodisca vitripennis]|nr:hypothetical protein J6590_028277 [Homalodisca vitripennis]
MCESQGVLTTGFKLTSQKLADCNRCNDRKPRDFAGPQPHRLCVSLCGLSFGKLLKVFVLCGLICKLSFVPLWTDIWKLLKVCVSLCGLTFGKLLKVCVSLCGLTFGKLLKVCVSLCGLTFGKLLKVCVSLCGLTFGKLLKVCVSLCGLTFGKLLKVCVSLCGLTFGKLLKRITQTTVRGVTVALREDPPIERVVPPKNWQQLVKLWQKGEKLGKLDVSQQEGTGHVSRPVGAWSHDLDQLTSFVMSPTRVCLSVCLAHAMSPPADIFADFRISFTSMNKEIFIAVSDGLLVWAIMNAPSS